MKFCEIWPGACGRLADCAWSSKRDRLLRRYCSCWGPSHAHFSAVWPIPKSLNRHEKDFWWFLIFSVQRWCSLILHSWWMTLRVRRSFAPMFCNPPDLDHSLSSLVGEQEYLVGLEVSRKYTINAIFFRFYQIPTVENQRAPSHPKPQTIAKHTVFVETRTFAVRAMVDSKTIGDVGSESLRDWPHFEVGRRPDLGACERIQVGRSPNCFDQLLVAFVCFCTLLTWRTFDISWGYLAPAFQALKISKKLIWKILKVWKLRHYLTPQGVLYWSPV